MRRLLRVSAAKDGREYILFPEQPLNNRVPALLERHREDGTARFSYKDEEGIRRALLLEPDDLIEVIQ